MVPLLSPEIIIMYGHELKLGDPAKRVNFWQWFQKFVTRRIDILNTTVFSDEAWFLPHKVC